MFKIIMNKGFHITFENGYTISCQFGNSNYCDNYRCGTGEYKAEMSQDITKCENCEVAIWDKNNNWVTGNIVTALGMESQEEMVQGTVTSNEVAKIIEYISKL